MKPAPAFQSSVLSVAPPRIADIGHATCAFARPLSLGPARRARRARTASCSLPGGSSGGGSGPSDNDDDPDYYYQRQQDQGETHNEPLPSMCPDRFIRVRVFSLGPPDPATAATILTLLPEDPTDGDGFKTAFRMSISSHQAKTIRDLLIDGDAVDASNQNQTNHDKNARNSSKASTTDSSSGNATGKGNAKKGKTKKKIATSNAAWQAHENEEQIESVRRYRQRPTTHALFKALLDAQGGQITEAAITHILSDVFIASIYVSPGQMALNGSRGFTLDARPSDAIAIAAQANAPLYLNRELMRAWPVSVAAIQLDAAAGLCECLPPYLPLQELSTSHPTFADAGGPDISAINRQQTTSERSRIDDRSDAQFAFHVRDVFIFESNNAAGKPRVQPHHAPDYERLLNLYSHLDVAVRCERYGDAARLRDEIDLLCPLDRLRDSLAEAVKDERFLDAAQLRDEITRWEVTLERWGSPDMTSAGWNYSGSSSLPLWERDRCDNDVGWEERSNKPPFPERTWVDYDISLDFDYLDTSAQPTDMNDQDTGAGGNDASPDTDPSSSDS